MKRVLVTGGTGFIGRHTLSLLVQRGYEVHAVSSGLRDSDINVEGVEWHRLDLLDPAQVTALLEKVQPTHLLHLAWYAVHREFWTSEENLRWVEASLRLLQSFAHSGGQRVVAAGSCAEYDWSYGFCSEGVTPLQPATLYGTCKHATQLIMETFARQAGLSLAWGRVFFLYGPYEHPDRLVSSVITSLLKGQPARTTHCNQIRDFMYVEDIASAFVALLDSDVAGAVNIASGQAVTLKDVVRKIATMVGADDLIRLGEIPVSQSEPPLLVADVRRLHSEVGWCPAYSLEAGLQITVDWWRHKLQVLDSYEA